MSNANKTTTTFLLLLLTDNNKEIYKYSGGIPRLINTLCERSLIGAYGANLPLVKKDIVQNAAAEVLGKKARPKMSAAFGWPVIITVMAASIILTLGIWGTVLNQKAPVTEAQANIAREPSSATGSGQHDLGQGKSEAFVRPASGQVQSKANLPIAQKLDTYVGEANTFSAFTNLFALSDRDYSAYSGDTACSRAIKAGMRCIFGQGKIDDILKYNRPAVIELKSNTQQILFAVIHKADESKAYLKVVDKDMVVSYEELEQTWSGSYIVLWKPPFPQNESLAQGYVGPDVLWLRHKLDTIEGKKLAEYSEDNLKFNASLVARVKQFQSNRGLQSDGVVGRETFIELVNVTDSTTVPKLFTDIRG